MQTRGSIETLILIGRTQFFLAGRDRKDSEWGSIMTNFNGKRWFKVFENGRRET